MRTLCFLVACSLTLASTRAQPELDQYNVVWQSPSADASGSMPIGNGETGLNVWVETSGDLLLLLARTDAWSETDRLLKLGRVRVSFTPSPFAATTTFRQELVLREGRIEIRAGESAAIRIFVNPQRSDIHIEGEFAQPTAITATLERWRTERKTFENDDDLRSSWTMHSAPASVRSEIVWESPDVVVTDSAAVTWYHRNEHSVVPFTLRHQGLESVVGGFKDPLLHRTFGARMSGAGLAAKGPGVLASPGPVGSLDLRITTQSLQTPSAEAWLAELARRDAATPPTTDARARTAAWWQAFWDRSWISITGDPALGAGPPPPNAHPLRIGADSNGANVYRGSIVEAAVYERPLSAKEVEAACRPASAPRELIADAWGKWPRERGRAVPTLAFGPATLRPVGAARVGMPAPDLDALLFEGGHFEVPADESPAFPRGFTLTATLRDRRGEDPCRIFDKMTAGGSDGFIFDTHPGDSLRLMVGRRTIHAKGVLKPDAPQRVAATFDAATGSMEIYLNGSLVAQSAQDATPPSSITRAYILQRWIAACGGRHVDGDAAFPIKFNGSIFTVEPSFTEGQPHNPDWRKWGGCFWWQNTRLLYYPMLAAGDFDLMDPLFRFYEAAAPGCRARAELYHSAKGLYFPETMTTFGTYGNGDYGWKRDGVASSVVQCPWWQYAWQQGLELSQLMLDHAAYTGDERFLVERAIPVATDSLRYFDSRFARDGRGKLIISPTQAVETYWHDVVNDAPSVGGLHAVCDALLALPDRIGPADDRALWRRVKDATPELPTWTPEGTDIRAAAPAERFKNQRNNCETAELYPLFPFRQYGLGKPGLDLAIEAYRRRVDKSTVGWTQDGMFAAMLGLTEEARANLQAKAANSRDRFRFPAMWGPNFDWLPDQCHGSNLMTTLQLMLLQCEEGQGGRIRVLPAWHRAWDVSFKLHAPCQTTVECEFRDGRIQMLKVTPESRRKGIVLPDWTVPPDAQKPTRP